MIKNVYITKKLYDYINEIASSNENEQMMVFGGKTIGNTIVIDEGSFKHFKDDIVLENDNETVEVSLREIEKEMKNSNKLGNDTFIMTHSHPCSPLIEFMYGDLGNEDEVISKKLRETSSKYNMEYYDGITTGKKLYFWSTLDEGNSPKLMDCFVDNKPVEYNSLTSITEDLEHLFKM